VRTICNHILVKVADPQLLNTHACIQQKHCVYICVCVCVRVIHLQLQQKSHFIPCHRQKSVAGIKRQMETLIKMNGSIYIYIYIRAWHRQSLKLLDKTKARSPICGLSTIHLHPPTFTKSTYTSTNCLSTTITTIWVVASVSDI
jgi:hypothetical protein